MHEKSLFSTNQMPQPTLIFLLTKFFCGIIFVYCDYFCTFI